MTGKCEKRNRAIGWCSGAIDPAAVLEILEDGLMNLPIPNVEEVSRMQALYKAEVGIQLTPKQAYDVLSRVAQYLMNRYILYARKSQEEGRQQQSIDDQVRIMSEVAESTPSKILFTHLTNLTVRQEA